MMYSAERSTIFSAYQPDRFSISLQEGCVPVQVTNELGSPEGVAKLVGFHSKIVDRTFRQGEAWLAGDALGIGRRVISGITQQPEIYVENAIVEFRAGSLPTIRAVELPT